MDIMKMGKNPNYLGSWDLEDVPNGEITLTIAGIRDEAVTGAEGRKENCTVCYFAEPQYKPMILNITNKKRIIKLYKTRESDKLKGKRVTIITEPVRAFGGVYDALRIKPVLPPAAEEYVKCENCGEPILPTGNMTSKQAAAYCKKKIGKALCLKCAKIAAEEIKAKQEAEKAKSGPAEEEKADGTEQQ